MALKTPPKKKHTCCCKQCVIISNSEGSWCKNTGIEVRGPEFVSTFSSHSHTGDTLYTKPSNSQKTAKRTEARHRHARIEGGIAAIHGHVASLLCKGKVRDRARKSRRVSFLSSTMAKMRPLIKANRKKQPCLKDIMAAMVTKPFMFPCGLEPTDPRTMRLARFIQEVIRRIPTARSRTAIRQTVHISTATILWKMGIGGSGDAKLLPQPPWLSTCSIPDNAYVHFKVPHRAMTRQWLRVLKPLLCDTPTIRYTNI